MRLTYFDGGSKSGGGGRVVVEGWRELDRGFLERLQMLERE